jgi:heptosyltransferase-3
MTGETSVLDRVPHNGRIAIIRLRSMGDCVLTTPAIEILKATRPDLVIGVVVEDRFAAIFEGHPAVSAILPPSYAAIFGWRPALCLNLHGGTRSMLLSLASRAPIRAGFGHHRGAFLYHVRIPRAQEVLGVERTVHTAEHLASSMFYLGCPVQRIPRARVFAEPRPRTGRYAVLHPVAAASYKTWHAQGFLAAAEHVQRTYSLEPVFIGGAGDDMTAFRGYRCVTGAPLGQVKSLLAGASLFVGNDSGPAHIAAALGVPLVVLFGRLDHQLIWAPWQTAASRTLASAQGISGIRTEDVIAAIAQLQLSLGA